MAKSNFAQNALTGVLVICAVMVTVSMVHREFFTETQSSGVTGQKVENWKDLTQGRVSAYGNSSAPVTILDFSDYECPFCKAMEGTLARVEADIPGGIRVVRFELPLVAIHHNAYTAALAAKCAEQQGVVAPFQKLIYAENTKLSTLNWSDVAISANVKDLNSFNSCLEGKKTAPMINKDMALAESLGFKGTPTLIINGEVVKGIESEQSLVGIVKGMKN